MESKARRFKPSSVTKLPDFTHSKHQTSLEGSKTKPGTAEVEHDTVEKPDVAETEPDAAKTKPDAAETEPDAAETKPDAAETTV